MGNRHTSNQIFSTVSREVAVQKWAGWWSNYLEEQYHGSPSTACLAIFGKGSTGSPKSLSQANKWKYAENNSLPSAMLTQLILADAELKLGREVDASEFIEHDLPFIQINQNKQGPRQEGSTMAKKRSDAVFTIDDETIEAPKMSFSSSEEHPGYYDFKLDAVLPMGGVLALMALLEDATS